MRALRRESDFNRARRVLPNGLTVLALDRPHLPIVSTTLLIPGGVADEPEDRPGVAFFTSQLLPLGTKRRSAVDLAEVVDGLGGTLSVGCDFDYATVDLTGLARDTGRLIDLLAEVTQEPAFAPDEIERKRSQILGLLDRRRDDHIDVVRNRFFETIYGAHPYKRTKEGTPESVRAIGRDDLASHYEARFKPKGSILAVCGDVRADEVFRRVEERFGGWDGGPAAGAPRPAMPAAGERSVVTIQQEVTQATIRMGNVGIPRDHADYHAAVLLNYILGGSGFGSRLMKSLREEKGLTYGVYSNFWTRREPGYFFAGTQTRLETMNEAVAAMLHEIERFVETGATEEELAWAKKYFTGSLPLTLETNDQIAVKLLEQEFYGLPDRFWLLDIERMTAVTTAEVLEVARRHIHPERFAFVVLADFRGRALEVPAART